MFGDGRALVRIKEVALDKDVALPRRRAALRSLIDARADGFRAVCEQLMAVRHLSAVAASGLALFDDLAVADRLLAEWPVLDGAEKPPVLNVLLARPAWTMKLLDAIAAGKVRRTELGVAQARQIRALHDDALTQRLTDTWGAIQDTDDATKRAAMQSWRQKLGPEALKRADPAEGRKLYMQSCGACHLFYGAGGSIGPDLTGSGRQNLDYLLENILFPSAIVAPEFRQTTLTLKDGRSLSGVIRSRNNQAVVIQMIGETATVGLSDIAQQETSPLSLMPEGLLDGLTGVQALDLFSYLMSRSPPAGR